MLAIQPHSSNKDAGHSASYFQHHELLTCEYVQRTKANNLEVLVRIKTIKYDVHEHLHALLQIKYLAPKNSKTTSSFLNIY